MTCAAPFVVVGEAEFTVCLKLTQVFEKDSISAMGFSHTTAHDSLSKSTCSTMTMYYIVSKINRKLRATKL